MPKIHDNVDIKGKMTGNIESDNTHFKDATDDTKVLKLNQQGQTTAQMVTLYSFENGAFVVEPETPNLQNVTEGYVFFWIPNLPNTFQVTANHNPTGWALVNAPSGVTIDQNGLISWDGLGAVSTGTVTIQVTNIFGTSNTDVTMTVTAGYSGTPVMALDTLQISGGGFNQGDPIQTWSDASGNSNNFEQLTLGDQPTVDIDAFAGGVNGLRFDGLSQFMTTTTPTGSIYTINAGAEGEAFITFRFDGSIPTVCPLLWSPNSLSQYHIVATYYAPVNGIQLYMGNPVGGNNFLFTPVVGTTYILRVAWSSGNYVELQFEGESTQQFATTGGCSAIGNTYGNIIAGADENTPKLTYGSNPIYADVTFGTLVVYSNLLSGAQRQANFDYIKSIWKP